MALTKRGKNLLPYLENPNVLAFLDTIADAEGVDYGYKTGFGNVKLKDLKDHPRTLRSFTQTDGKKNKSSAAGRYQFLTDTWDELAGGLGLSDFTERNQDLGALELIRRKGVLDEIAQGKYENAFAKLGGTWASLPSSPYKQPNRSDKFILDSLNKNLASRQADKPSAGEQEQMIARASREDHKTAQAFNVRERLRQSQNEPQGDVAQLVSDSLARNLEEPSLTPESMDLDSTLQKEIFRRLADFDMVAPGWAEDVQAAQTPDLLQDTAEGGFAPWEEELLSRSIAADADDARSEAQAAFFGEQSVPKNTLPNPIERAIARVVSLL